MNALEIKENRKRLKLTQEELGKLLGVSKRTIINYEQGEVVPPTKSELLHKILLGEKVDEKEKPPSYLDGLAKELFSNETFLNNLRHEINEANKALEMARLEITKDKFLKDLNKSK